MELKRRANGKGCAVYLGAHRSKPWGARITLGLDQNGLSIRHILGTFDNKLDALFCLEQYYKNPTPIYIKTSKYNRIVNFSSTLYPLVPLDNPKKQLISRISKKNYTFGQVYEEFTKLKFPTNEEKKLENTKNIKPQGKFSSNYASNLRNAAAFVKTIYYTVYANLTTSDFQTVLNDATKQGYSRSFTTNLLTLFKHLDTYALQENIITRGYAQYVTNNTAKGKKVTKTIFSPEEILELKNLRTDTYIAEVIKNMYIFALYSGCRASEIIFLRTKNIHLDEGFFVTGIKTEAGKNREIPIHPELRKIIEKYFNKENEFLFMYRDKPINYSSIFFKHSHKLMNKFHKLGNHTIHECRHTFRTELERLNIKQIIINNILGHKNNDIGLDVYTHITLAEKTQAVRLINYEKNTNLPIIKNN